MISIPFRPLRGGLAQRVLAPSAALLAGACASYQPQPLVPGDELAALQARQLEGFAYVAEPAARERAAGFDLSDGLDEDELVAVALTWNPRLRAKRLEIGESAALLVAAGLWPNPELGIAVRPGIDGAVGTGVEIDALTALLRPGERQARRGVALARLDTVRTEVAALELELIAEVRKARIDVLAAREQALLAEGEAALREQAAELLHRRAELGEASALELLLVDLEAAELRRQLREVQADRLRARRRLNELLGLEADCELELAHSDRLVFAVLAEPTDEELDRRLLAGRFDLHAKEAEYARAEEELRLAIARQGPELALGPSFERDVEQSQALGVGAGIEIPLFDRNQGEIAEKRAARERARAEYAAKLHALRAAAFGARAELARARAEVEAQQREILPLVERTEALFEGAFRAGELSVFEWISARTRALQARREFLRALVRHSAAAADLEAALGIELRDAAGETKDR